MKRPVPYDTRAKQALAADPRLFAWVSANAGSGKTHVLTQRVVRLLLDDVEPARIFCLTFTRAAAANMSARVFKMLGAWTLLEDAELAAAIEATGAPAPKSLAPARALFARALETPGGLKIQTLHAFCERLLHLFPFEANAPADFRVLDETEQSEWLAAARREALELSARDAPDALAVLARETGEDRFERIVADVLRDMDAIDDLDAHEISLRAALGLAEGEDERQIAREILEDGFHWNMWGELAAVFDAGSATDRKVAQALRAAAAFAPGAGAVGPYLRIFLTEDSETKTLRPKARVATKAVAEPGSDLKTRLDAEAERLCNLLARMNAAQAFVRTQALLCVAGLVRARYAQMKRDRSALDYDDLIARARHLLGRSGAAAWALYKLDGGIDHILVDEAQDTSLAQWDILQRLSEEFTTGAGAARGFRSFFAVGDEKQSIFSFQGAAPAAFAAMRRAFERRSAQARLRFEHVRLDLSFRSAPIVLEAVDHVFAREEARRGLGEKGEPPPAHAALKIDVAGLVEVWPPILKTKTPDPDEWALPLDQPRESDPAAELARRIARRIAAMIAPDSHERVADETPGGLRRIAAGDIMILVRRRDALFEHLVRALKEARVPVAGADRLDVGGHIAVMDLVAAMRAALAPQDDLTLASLLKSPLFGLDDDDLIALAPHRPGSLWAALGASSAPAHRAAAARIARWIARASGARPFDFLSDILGPEGGRKAMLARLGPEAADALDELLSLALAHERQDAPSLAAFAHRIGQLQLSVRRDMEAAGALVRVMTVHAAKGLEAKIVFLPDTCRAPAPSLGATFFRLGPPDAPVLVWSPRKAEDPPPVAAARAALRESAEEEYRRLLYVAMTRAEERLYIAGHCDATGPQEGSWYALVTAALAEYASETPADFDPGQNLLRIGAPNMVSECADFHAARAPEHLPEWVLRAAAPEREAAPPLRPSSALAAADAPARARASPDEANARGLLLHRLLQSLPDIAVERRADAAQAFLAVAAPGLADARVLIQEALDTLSAPALQPFFGPSSRAEVALAARIARAGRAALDIAGRIDRLAEVGDEIWIADFKTGAPAAHASHITQMALYRAGLERLYPSRAVRAFLVFTRNAQAQELRAADMAAALADL